MLRKIMSILICCASTSIFAENWLGSDNSKVDVDTLEHFKATNSFALTIHTSVGDNLYMKAKLYIYCNSNEYQFKSIRAYKMVNWRELKMNGVKTYFGSIERFNNL